MFLKKTYPAFLWTALIFILCSMPGKAIPHISWLELLSFDKFVHASIFFVLQVLFMRGFVLQTNFIILRQYYKWITLFICITYGGILEVMQSYCFTERSGDVLDFIANSFGCVIGVLCFQKLQNRLAFFKG